jgi:hypothetical protein
MLFGGDSEGLGRPACKNILDCNRVLRGLQTVAPPDPELCAIVEQSVTTCYNRRSRNLYSDSGETIHSWKVLNVMPFCRDRATRNTQAKKHIHKEPLVCIFTRKETCYKFSKHNYLTHYCEIFSNPEVKFSDNTHKIEARRDGPTSNSSCGRPCFETRRVFKCGEVQDDPEAFRRA